MIRMHEMILELFRVPVIYFADKTSIEITDC